MKGSDASWENDNEPPPSHMDYSDDESERKERKSRRSYVPPTGQARSNNAFYRRERHYNPRNYGPMTYNSVHTLHIQPPPHMPPNPNLNSSHSQQYNNPPPMYFP